MNAENKRQVMWTPYETSQDTWAVKSRLNMNEGASLSGLRQKKTFPVIGDR